MKITLKNADKFKCEYCDFKCSKQSDWERHINTLKHNKHLYLNNIEQNYAKKTPLYICSNCNKIYKARTSLWYHKQKCKITIYEPKPELFKPELLKTELFKPELLKINNSQITPELIIELIHQNKELQQTLIDQNKTIIELAQKAGNNNNNNNNNKTFNLQVFLNETCKDAINLSDFVEQIQVSISDLEETGKLGYAEGISKVFIKNLNDIDYSNRPIHCSDSKRETLYIKDDNQWTKDDDKKSNLTKAIKQVANKNIKKISEWQQLNPHYSDPDSKENDKYMKIVLNSMSGSTKEESDKNYEKIVKNIAKEVIIEKLS
jgi:hypothetical protein